MTMLQFPHTYVNESVADMDEQWITVREAADIMNVAVSNVRYLCANGRIECRKFGHVWQVSKQAAEDYVRSNRNPDWLHETDKNL